MGRDRRALQALAGDLARQLGYTPVDARRALDELRRAGLVSVAAGRVALPLTPVVADVGGGRSAS